MVLSSLTPTPKTIKILLTAHKYFHHIWTIKIKKNI